jgi:hypothetical protein
MGVRFIDIVQVGHLPTVQDDLHVHTWAGSASGDLSGQLQLTAADSLSSTYTVVVDEDVPAKADVAAKVAAEAVLYPRHTVLQGSAVHGVSRLHPVVHAPAQHLHNSSIEQLLH